MTTTKSLDGSSPRHNQAVREAPASRVVPKPVPESQVRDARGYQVDQLKRRFSPKEKEGAANGSGSTRLSFRLKPSDPDFPFELDYLELELEVPRNYPKSPPTLAVGSKNIPRGFAINIEKGWNRLVQEKRGATLLSMVNSLDRNLEKLLSEEKADTVKISIFRDTRHIESASSPQPVAAESSASAPAPAPQSRPYTPEPSYTREQISTAKAKRAQEIRQLEARMGRDPLYHKSSDGIVYTLPCDPRRRSELPVGLQTVRSFQLILPLLYPLQSIRILLNEVNSEDAEAVEELFAKTAAEQKQMTLMSLVNYLAQNLHALAKQVQAEQKAALATQPQTEARDAVAESKSEHLAVADDAKSHIKVIPRPPEWSHGHESGTSDDDDDDDDYDSDEDEEEEGGVSVAAAAATTKPDSSTMGGPVAEKGIAMSFPSVELYGIELLQVSVLSISVRCERCRTINDITGLRANTEKASSCKKCGTPFTTRFRPEFVHQNSTRAGFIDVTACAVTDMLPSTFVPTCATCSTPVQGFVSVRGETTTNVCRQCHGRFTFKIPEVKFLAYSLGSSVLPPTSGPRRKLEKLGINAGEALPDQGACTHYKRSYRWFRFSCCSKVYSCDKCHDDAEDHINEWANRMICGYCSREQNFSPDTCAFCGRSVIGKKGKGYWEGGKGTRNKTLMRRGDKRKYKRVGGGEARKAD